MRGASISCRGNATPPQSVCSKGTDSSATRSDNRVNDDVLVPEEIDLVQPRIIEQALIMLALAAERLFAPVLREQGSVVYIEPYSAGADIV